MQELLELQKHKELMKTRLENERYVKEAFEEAFGSKLQYEILSRDETDLIIKDFTNTFPITFWNRIDWNNKSVKKQAIGFDEVKSIPSILKQKGFNFSNAIYVFWGFNEYPGVRTVLRPLLLENFEEIIWIGSDMYYYCPSEKYIIEFFHDDSINIGLISY